ncbi:MAG TPA: 1-(5-phosphoribosyl)-5-[(5-phosphoribosylamino)methylideneamino]imidazole-4-carboxamide isomerase [Lysobacter sp.]
MNAVATSSATADFTLYPAIDVRDGRVVRLHQGDYARETRYEPTPLALAGAYARDGATWLHLVDLDAARQGGYTLRGLLRDLRQTTSLRIQTGGGVRSEDDVAAILDAGADRVVVGSLAVREPARVLGWIERYGSERITVALDARQDADGAWRLPTAGWTQDSDVQLEALVARYADGGLRHLLCTDIARDGMLSGPNLSLYRHLAARAPRLCVQASGGVRDVADIVAAQAAGCRGAVLGKALIEGRFALADALAGAASC